MLMYTYRGLCTSWTPNKHGDLPTVDESRDATQSSAIGGAFMGVFQQEPYKICNI